MFDSAHIPMVSCVEICINTPFYRELVSHCVRIGQKMGNFHSNSHSMDLIYQKVYMNTF